MHNNWVIQTENQFLVLRDKSTHGDHRFAFAPALGNGKNHGPINFPDQHSSTLASFHNWQIVEENSVLCIRDVATGGDHRFAFFPGCGNQHNFGNPHTPAHSGNHIYYVGKRWRIQEENGILVFRDTLTPGDHRYAFWPACGNNIWL